MKRKLTSIKFDKEGNITKFGYLDHNSQQVTHSGIVFNCDNFVSFLTKFIADLSQRHYPVKINDFFTIIGITIGYEFDEPCKLSFSVKVTDEECGEMSFSFPSLPRQIVERNSDLIDTLSDVAIAEWDNFYDSLPKQQELFALPELKELKHES
jgi:hypothetical protein